MKLGPTYPEEQKKKKVKKCILALYPNTEVISTAVRDKFDLIICYTTPGIWANFNQITDELYPKIKILLENRINLYKIQEEYAESGLIDLIAEVFNLEVIDLLQIKNAMNQDKTAGCVCKITTPSNNLLNFLTMIKEKLDISPIRFLGDLNSSIQKVGIIIGHPLNLQLLKMAKKADIDTIVCNHFTYNSEKTAEELDINLIEVTSYVISLGLLKLTQILRMEEPTVEFAFINLKPSFKTF